MIYAFIVASVLAVAPPPVEAPTYYRVPVVAEHSEGILKQVGWQKVEWRPYREVLYCVRDTTRKPERPYPGKATVVCVTKHETKKGIVLTWWDDIEATELGT